MEAKEIFVLIFERQGNNCGDKEIRLCKADSYQDAINIAKKYKDMFYTNWSVSINTICWDKEGTAYVYCDIK